MKATARPSPTDFAQVRRLAAQLQIRERQPFIRNLEFYQKAEEKLPGNRNPYGSGGMRLSPCWAER